MPRARHYQEEEGQTAAPLQGSGCLPPMFAVFLIACLLTVIAINTPVPILAAAQKPPTALSPIFTREVHYWADNIIRWADASFLDPNLVAVVMQIESCGDPFARSSAGAMGLFQVMPFHFQAGEDPYNPNTNALRGLNYLARSLEASQGNIRDALAGYNGGIGVISGGEWTWSAQTLRYVYYGAPIYEDAQGGSASSSRLDEWYGKYGAGLCKQAGKRLGLN